MRNALIALGAIGGFVFLGFVGITFASAHEGWAPDTQIVSTLITMLLCFYYFFTPRKHLYSWYRVLMLWAAVLMFSYLTSPVILGTKPYNQWIEKVFGVPVAFLASPIWVLFALIFFQFIRSPASENRFEVQSRTNTYLAFVDRDCFCFLNGIQALPREWGPLGLNETAILGMIYGFLVLFSSSSRINLFVASITGFFLVMYVVQPLGMDTGFGYAFEFLWVNPSTLGRLPMS